MPALTCRDALNEWLIELKDFSGQDLAYKIQEFLVIVTGIAAFVVGFYHQDFSYTVKIIFAGLAITLVVSFRRALSLLLRGNTAQFG